MGTIEEAVRRASSAVPGVSSIGNRRLGASGDNAGARWIATLPEVTLDAGILAQNRIVGGIDDDAARNSYLMLRTRALQRMKQNDWHVIMVSSPEQGDGKSVTAVNFAISLAMESTLSVVLMDLDMRRSGTSKYLGINAHAGVSQYLEGHAALDEVLCRPAGIDRLAIVPNTSPCQKTSELLSAPRMGDLIAALRGADEGRVVVCDLPPLLATDDAIAFSPLADALLMVVSEGVTKRESLNRCGELIENMDLLGIVLNRAREKGAGAYEYY